MNRKRFGEFLKIKYLHVFKSPYLKKAYQINLKLSKNILLCQETTHEVSGGKKIGLKKIYRVLE